MPRTLPLQTALLLLFLIPLPTCPAQNNQGPGGGFPGGILINADGLVSSTSPAEVISPAILRKLQRTPGSPADEAPLPNTQRVISLRELDYKLKVTLADGSSPGPYLRYPGGLTRIDAVFLSAEHDDVLLAGPAENIVRLPSGRMIGSASGRPLLILEDLLTAFRTADLLREAGCSIDPVPAQLQYAQQWLQQNATAATIQVQSARLRHMVQLMGNWEITTFGVPQGSRMCAAMIEADYRMKRLAIGLDNPGIRQLRSSLAAARPGDNMMRRWWFAPAADVLQRNPEGTCWTITGPRLTLFAQEEIIGAGGQLQDAPTAKGSASAFADSFNECFDELTSRIPAFADLQNTVDVLLLTAIVRELQASGQLQWTPLALTDTTLLPSTIYHTPTQTQPMLTTRSGPGGSLIGCFSGGVRLSPAQMVQQASQMAEAPDELLLNLTVEPAAEWYRDLQNYRRSP